MINLNLGNCKREGLQKWLFHRANWAKFTYISDQEISKISITQDIDHLNSCICEVLLEAPEQTIPRSHRTHRKTIAPWWTQECATAVRS